MRGDDVLDLRAVLGLLQAQGVDQNALIGDGRRNALELGQRTAAAGQLFEDGGRVEAGDVQLFERVEGGHGGPGAGWNVYRKNDFLYMLASICIENGVF